MFFSHIVRNLGFSLPLSRCLCIPNNLILIGFDLPDTLYPPAFVCLCFFQWCLAYVSWAGLVLIWQSSEMTGWKGSLQQRGCFFSAPLESITFAIYSLAYHSASETSFPVSVLVLYLLASFIWAGHVWRNTECALGSEALILHDPLWVDVQFSLPRFSAVGLLTLVIRVQNARPSLPWKMTCLFSSYCRNVCIYLPS